MLVFKSCDHHTNSINLIDSTETLYEQMTEEIGNQHPSKSHFYQIWKKNLKHIVIPRVSCKDDLIFYMFS